MDKKQKLFWLNFKMRNKALLPLIMILLVAVMVLLHQTGILTAVSTYQQDATTGLLN